MPDDRDARFAADGWVKLGPGVWTPGPELKARLDRQRREGVPKDKMIAFVRKWAGSPEIADEILTDMKLL
jgi:hypothetical protein